MNNTLSKELIDEMVNKIIESRLQINLSSLSENYKIENLLGRKFGIRPRDLLCLFFEIEKEFNIRIPSEEVENGNFCTIDKIVSIIYNQLA